MIILFPPSRENNITAKIRGQGDATHPGKIPLPLLIIHSLTGDLPVIHFRTIVIWRHFRFHVVE